MELINKHPKIFIISGHAQSGKDLVADLICKFYSNKKCKKLSYAYYLKHYVQDIMGWDGSNISKPRTILQEFGIELLKKHISNTFLIDRLCDDIKIYSFFYDVIIITDARLILEVETPKNLFKNITTIRIKRLKENTLSADEKKHITETNLDNYTNFDYTILNNDNYDELVNNVYTILEGIK